MGRLDDDGSGRGDDDISLFHGLADETEHDPSTRASDDALTRLVVDATCDANGAILDELLAALTIGAELMDDAAYGDALALCLDVVRDRGRSLASRRKVAHALSLAADDAFVDGAFTSWLVSDDGDERVLALLAMAQPRARHRVASMAPLVADDVSHVAAAAADALSVIGGREAALVLVDATAREPDVTRRRVFTAALSRIDEKGPRVRDALFTLVHDADSEVRLSAIVGLAARGVLGSLTRALVDDHDVRVRLVVAQSLDDVGASSDRALVARLLADADPRVASVVRARSAHLAHKDVLFA